MTISEVAVTVEASSVRVVPVAGASVTAAEALQSMRMRGVTIKEWAASNGFNAAVVYSVLSGRRKCLRGQSHEIAVALGMKEAIR